jgi:hypothetical protein
MRSHLTRSVFRRLLANEPIVHRGCLRRHHCSTLASYTTPAKIRAVRNGRIALLEQQRRHIFNFNIFGKKNEAKEPDLAPGIDKMEELAKRQRMNARLPSYEEVREAVQRFVASRKSLKSGRKTDLTDTQAQLLLQTLRFLYAEYDALQEQGQSPHHPLGRTRGRRDFLMWVVRNVEHPTAAHVELAKVLYESLSSCSRRRYRLNSLLSYVTILCRAGSTRFASDLVWQSELSKGMEEVSAAAQEEGGEGDQLEQDEIEDSSKSLEVEEGIQSTMFPYLAYLTLLRGFIRENDADGVQHSLSEIEALGNADNRAPVVSMIEFSVQNDDVAGMKRWWKRLDSSRDPDPPKPGTLTSGDVVDKILKWCLKHNQREVGQEIVRDAMSTNPPKSMWDAIFVWAAGTKKSVDEIDRMIGVMEQSNRSLSDAGQARKADNTTINRLVEFAVLQNDPYMAERFIALGRKRNIEPDAKTYVLQMDYRLSVGDVDGALIAYKALVEFRDAQYSEDINTEDISTINRLVVALCGTQRHDFDTIMNVTMDLADKQAAFEAETVSKLALLHLNRNEEDDAMDLLNTHAFHFSSADRAIVRNSLIEYALDPQTATSRAWQGYTILRTVFDETNRDDRTALMTSFFSRERADMGVRIFQHMRMHSRADTMPTVDTYVAAFMGLAKLRDVDSVEIVHNQLKLDYNITVTTYLRNALIIAYTAGDKGRKALGFWDDIVASKEGPSYNSIHVALRACEKSPFGDLRAKELWSLLRRRSVDLDQALWASYIAALAGNGDNDTAINAVEEAEAKGELEIDSFILGSLFDGAAGASKQAEIEAWARERYPQVMQELEGLGFEEDEIGMRKFKIDRRVAP